jgi:hypothetical protein
MNDKKNFEDAKNCEDIVLGFYQKLMEDSDKHKECIKDGTLESMKDTMVFLTALVNMQGLLLQFNHGLHCLDNRDVMRMSDLICTMAEKSLNQWDAYSVTAV